MESKYTKLTLREQILYNPSMYIGPIDKQTKMVWLWDQDENAIIEKQIEVVPGFLGIFDEIIVNATDNYYHSQDVVMTEIRVNIDQQGQQISVYNTGRGIPIEKHQQYDMYLPQFIFSELLTSSNYKNKERITGGMNGYGAKLTNIFSKYFMVETYDKQTKQLYTQEFADNMTQIGKPQIQQRVAGKTHYTKVTFKPDLSKFKMVSIDDDTYNYLQRRVIDVAGTMPFIKTYLNDSLIELTSFKQYVQLYHDGDLFPNKSLSDGQQPKQELQWIVYVAPVHEQKRHISFVNRINTTEGGTHVDHVLNQIAYQVKEKLIKKLPNLKIQQIKSKLWVFINSTIQQPSFTTQSKESLCVQKEKLDKYYQIDPKIVKDLMKGGLKELLMQMQDDKELEKMHKALKTKCKSRLTGILKLEDANFAGTKKAEQCVLILTEGDSAKSLAMAGVEVINGGRDYYGVYPLRGKFLNVRDASKTQITENKEIQEMFQILGLDIKKKYTEADQLRYGSIMVMTDQDLDGSHIKGLLINFIHYFWPELCFVKKSFMKYFITPLIKVTANNQIVASFFSQSDFDQWWNQNNRKSYKVKYYKGLGTSTSAEAKQYFQNLELHMKSFISKNQQEDTQAIDLAFNKKRANDRKDWLETVSITDQIIDFKDKTMEYQTFINKELIHFSLYDCRRSIPSIMDGLKPCQRKILYSCFKRNLKEQIKVAQLSGYVAEHSSYHHGEQSLCMAIVQMAQDFTGSNNINLLMPIGQFGDRRSGTESAASPRYIYTKLNDLTRKLFIDDDELVLNYLEEEGARIEPEYYAPIIPMILVNGANGIGTGWRTDVPSFDIGDIIKGLFDRLSGQQFKPLRLWYKGFKGQIIVSQDGFTLKGNAEKQGKLTIINEIPATTLIQTFKKYLNDLIEKKQIDQFSEHHKDNNILFKISGIASNQDVYELIKPLQAKISTKNMVLFDTNGKIKRYESEVEILEEYYNTRLHLYDLRKQALIAKLQEIVKKLSNKYAFIMGIINGTIQMLGKKQDFVHQQLEEQQFSKFDDSFNYLTSMPIHSLTKEHAEKLKKEKEDAELKLKTLMDTSIEQLWINDLQQLLECLK